VVVGVVGLFVVGIGVGVAVAIVVIVSLRGGETDAIDVGEIGGVAVVFGNIELVTEPLVGCVESTTIGSADDALPESLLC